MYLWANLLGFNEGNAASSCKALDCERKPCLRLIPEIL